MHHRLLSGFLYILAFAVLAVLYYSVSLPAVYDTDTVMSLTAGLEMAQGNWLLKNWHLTTYPIYNTDLIFYAIAIKCFGLHFEIMHIIPAILLALVMVTGAFLYSLNDEGKIVLPKALLICILAAAISSIWVQNALRPLYHTGMMWMCLLSIIMLRYYYINHSKKLLFTIFALNTYILVGDTFAGQTYIIPAIATFMFFIVYDCRDKLKPKIQVKNFLNGARTSHKREITLIILYVLSILSYKAIRYLISVAGGFTLSGHSGFKFVRIEKIIPTVKLYMTGMIETFGLASPSFTGHFIGSFIIFILIAIGVVYGIKKEIKNPTLLGVLSIVTFLVMSAGCLLSRELVTKDSIRYMFLAVILIKMFGAASFFELIKNKGKTVYTAVMIISTAALLIALPLTSGWQVPKENEFTIIADFLKEKGLSDGYATHWYAGAVTVASDFNNNVRQIRIHGYPDEGKIYPFLWASSTLWYDLPGNYLILEESQEELKAIALNQFGTPEAIYNIENKMILVWDHNITPELARGTVRFKHFGRVRRDGTEKWIWGNNNARLLFANEYNFPVHVRIRFKLETGYDYNSNVYFSGLAEDIISANNQGTYYETVVTVPPGKHFIKIKTDAPRAKIPGEPPFVKFKISEFTVADEKP